MYRLCLSAGALLLALAMAQAQFNSFPPGVFDNRAALSPAGGGGGGGAVTISGTCTADGSALSPHSLTHTIAAGLTGSVLVFAVMTASNTTISSVTATWDPSTTNQSMTPLVNTTSGTAGVFLFGLRNPTPGTNLTLTSTFAGAGGQTIIAACTFQGANVTSDATAFPAASRVSATNLAPISVAVPSATGNIVWAGFGSVANFTSTSGVIGAGGCTGSCDNTGSQWATAHDYWNATGSSTTVSASPGSGTTSSVAAIGIAQ